MRSIKKQNSYAFSDKEQSVYEGEKSDRKGGSNVMKPMYQIINEAKRQKGGELKSTTEVDITSPDHLYYNLIIQNGTSAYQDTRFEETRAQALLDKCSEWNISVVNFRVPGENIPIVFSFDDTKYSITMTYNGSTVQTFLLYSDYPSNTVGARNIFYYTDFVLILNKAFTRCFAALLLLQPGLPGVAPKVYFNSTTLLMTLTASTAWDNYASASNPKLYMNQGLYPLFQSLPNIYDTVGTTVSGKDYQIIITDLGNNSSAGILSMIEEYSCLENWNTFVSLVFITNLIPINKESIPSSDGSGNVVGQSIFQEFQPGIGLGPEARGTLVYNSDLYRLTNLVNDVPLKDVDISIFWKDIYQVLHPIRIGPGDFANIKLMFRKKTLGVG